MAASDIDEATDFVLGVMAFAFLVPVMLWRAFVLSWLWQWFIVPLGGPALGIAQVIGISVLIAACSSGSTASDKSVPGYRWLVSVFSGFFNSLISLAIGYIALQFV